MMAAVAGIVALLPAAFAPGILESFARLAAPDSELHDRVWTERTDGSAVQIDHGAWDGFLGRYVRTDAAGVNRVAYGAVTDADRAALDAYIAALAAVDVPSLSGDEQLAYWINLYNAATVDLVLEHYPVDSIRDIGGGLLGTGPWDREVATVMGRALTLNEIEHGIIRPVWNDPRIHYAVNCAAVACPNLDLEAFGGANIDSRLDAAERAYVRDPRGVRLEGGELVLSSIWLWFRDDFGASEADVLARIAPLAEGAVADALANGAGVGSYDYDWALNRQ